jgi:parallel beta-helix repeat protein
MPTVSSVAGLIAALKTAGVGAVITLAPGDWSNVVIEHVEARNVTITGPGAIIRDLTLRDSSGITFDGLEFSTARAAVERFGAKATRLYNLRDDHDITFTRLMVHGDPAGTLATDVTAFMVIGSPHVTFSHNDFSHLHLAVAEGTSDHFTFTGNTCHDNRDDCIDNSGSSWVTITNNKCYSNHPDGRADLDHPDCIQFWTNGNAVLQHDIDIENNTYQRGAGTATQFIFMRANYPAPYNLPFTNVTIKHNTAEGSQLNGIVIMVGEKVDIEDNHIIAYCTPPDAKAWIHAMQVKGLTMRGNSAAHFATVGSSVIVDDRNVVSSCKSEPKQGKDRA